MQALSWQLPYFIMESIQLKKLKNIWTRKEYLLGFEHKHEAEGMTVFANYMAMAKTEEKLEALLLKDK